MIRMGTSFPDSIQGWALYTFPSALVTQLTGCHLSTWGPLSAWRASGSHSSPGSNLMDRQRLSISPSYIHTSTHIHGTYYTTQIHTKHTHIPPSLHKNTHTTHIYHIHRPHYITDTSHTHIPHTQNLCHFQLSFTVKAIVSWLLLFTPQHPKHRLLNYSAIFRLCSQLPSFPPIV
jgi:hypothetical protein